MKPNKDLLIERGCIAKSSSSWYVLATELNKSDTIGHWQLVKSLFDEPLDGKVIDECSKRFRNTFK